MAQWLLNLSSQSWVITMTGAEQRAELADGRALVRSRHTDFETR